MNSGNNEKILENKNKGIFDNKTIFDDVLNEKGDIAQLYINIWKKPEKTVMKIEEVRHTLKQPVWTHSKMLYMGKLIGDLDEIALKVKMYNGVPHEINNINNIIYIINDDDIENALEEWLNPYIIAYKLSYNR